MFEGLAEHCVTALRVGGCASVSVAVAREDAVVLAEAYGLADVAEGRPATSDTAYLLASVTKPITATAVCAAADAGLLDLDDPVEDHLSGVRLPRHRDYGAPTVRQVLQHRAGFGAHYDFFYADSPAIKPTARESIERYATLYREPGSGFEYSNLGYGILDVVLETVTGQDPATYVRDRVFGPLGLTSCHIGPTYEGPAQEALRYSADGRVYPVCDTTHRGATLAWATASDLAMFGLSQAGGRGILRPGTATAMRAALPVNAHLGYGLGWFVSRGSRHTIISHSGSMGGVATMLAVVPDLRLAVSVLTNQSGSAVRTAVAGHVMEELVPGFSLDSLPPGLPSERTATIRPGRWAGHVFTDAGALPLVLRVGAAARVEVELDGEAAQARFGGASEDWELRLSVPLQIPTRDARVNSPSLGLELNPDHDSCRDGRLVGAARAMRNGEGDGWLGNFLSHWCELERQD
ncbi:serine hydrolase [Microtetraspora sp. AC03309]|uniref:serine hydrolase domain-containing protein n=1 Tax=Microtetraspora sp. AC03309 TaxID=2779376 RepID=UPI001E282B71|nr:serine hydrolase domain-containing protein [Microtetraspora sp. AC03309]